jgi:hypothetical protein
MAISGGPGREYPDLDCLIASALRARRPSGNVLASAASARRFELVREALTGLPEHLGEDHVPDIQAAMRRTLSQRLPRTAIQVAERLSISTDQARVLLKVLAGMSITKAIGESVAKSGSTGSRWTPIATARIVEWIVNEDTRPRGLDEYLRFHIARCMHIDPRGLRRTWQSQGMMLPLTDVYSAARLGPVGPDEVAADRALTESGLHGETLQDELADDLLAFEEPEPGSGEAFARLIAERRWLVVLGDPGAGKTTMLKWLTLKNAQAIQRGEESLRVNGRHVGIPDEESVVLGPARLPVLMRVADYADELARRKTAREPLPSVYDFLGHHTIEDESLPGTAEDNCALISRYLTAGRALILFDGLDEITNTSMRKDIAHRIGLFIREHVPDPVLSRACTPDNDDENWWRTTDSRPEASGGNQVIVTSRRAGYKDAEITARVRTTMILPLREEAIKRFTHDWSLAAERHRALGSDATDEEIESRAAQSASALSEEILGDPRISSLATNPLLLTMLAFVREEQGPLPTHRAELYQRATSVLAQRRQAGCWTADEVVTILGPFALWLQEKSNKGNAPEGILREQVRGSLSRLRESVTETDVDEFVRAAREQAGLLIEVGPGRYGFMHPTFREYLAAREIARMPGNVESFLARHLHAPRWVETLRMCAAVASANRPETADDTIKHILEHGSPLEDLLHRDLLFAASCLHEMLNVTPTLAGEVIDRLFRAAAWAGQHRFGRLQQRLAEALTDLSVSMPHLTAPRLCEALRHASDITVAVAVAKRQHRPSGVLLDALDAACRFPRGNTLAHNARTEVARTLLGAASLDDRSYEPLRTLFDDHAEALARLESRWPAAARLMHKNRERVNPDLREAYEWLLERVPGNEDDDATGLRDRFLMELFARTQTRGSEFTMLWSTARALNPVAADRWLLESYAEGSIDLNAASRCLASVPQAFPSTLAGLERWFNPLPVTAQHILLEHQVLCRGSSPLVSVAWRYVVDAGELEAPARALLYRQAVTTSGLPASPAAFDAIRAMLRHDSAEIASLARSLLSRIRKTDQVTFGYLLKAAADQRGDLCSQQAAIMLSQSRLRFTPTGYDLIAKAIADQDGPLRDSAIAALHLERAARLVDDETIRRSWTHEAERLAAGDGAGTNAHGNFGMFVTFDDASRLTGIISDDNEWETPCRLTPAVARDLVTRAREIKPEVLGRALACCRLSTRGGQPSGTDIRSLAALCAELPEGPVGEAVRLLGEDAVLTGSWSDADRAVSHLADVGDLVSATSLLHAATWQLHRADTNRADTLPGILASTEALACQVSGAAESRAFRAVALLAQIAAAPGTPGPDTMRWISGVHEAATAILDALTTDYDWSYPTPPPGDLRAQLAGFTARLAERARGMRAIVDMVTTALRADDGGWERRRAALYVADTVAAAYPALFLREASPDLREQVLAAAGDPHSHSVRLLSVNVLSCFGRLDSGTLRVIARACRDQGWVSTMAVHRCQSFEVEHQPDTGEIAAMLGSEHRPTVMAAALLLSTLARSRYVSANEKATIEAALAQAIRSPDPALDVMGTRDGRSLRSWLHDLLIDAARRDKPLNAAHALGSWAVTGASPASPQQPPARPSQPPTESFTKTIRDLPVEPGSAVPSAAPLRLRDSDTLPSWEDLGLGDLPGPQLFHLARAIYSVLKMRVGAALAREMTDAQLDEFEAFIGAKDDHGAFAWLQANLPDYREVVRRHIEELLPELLRSGPAIRQALHERFSE